MIKPILPGDGGGGPSFSHLELLSRFQNCKGVPRISTAESPSTFFRKVEEDFFNLKDALSTPKWCGELYLELHQGTLTSQALLKKLNRQCEMQLRSLEALFAFCHAYTRFNEKEITNYQTQIRELWKVVLLNQFHDVL